MERVVLAEADWLERESRHRALVLPWVDAYRQRRSERRKHPIYDFLFEYYSTKRKNLRDWRPAVHETLQGELALRFLETGFYTRDEQGVRLNVEALDGEWSRRLHWVRDLLLSAKSRPPRFNCFGLHEWAMVYKVDRIRHEATPLRVSLDRVAQVVESLPIRCTHHDAFRFFTPEAVPLNEFQPGPEARCQNEQFGCLHFNMDLYRHCYKLSPFIGADLTRECFSLALEARQLDMQASPYDVRAYGFEPIEVDTPAGRELYLAAQKRIHECGQPLADRLLEEIDYALAAAAAGVEA